MKLEPLWDPKDLATYLKASRSWVYAAVQARTIPFLNVGGMIRFEPAKILDWVQSQTAEPPRERPKRRPARPERGQNF